MGSSRLQNNVNVDVQMVTITTVTLKERLNRIYEWRRNKRNFNSFEHLWDVKELALLEGKTSVEVPKTWLDELDAVLSGGATLRGS